jgi:hypothetical protein
VPVWTTDDFRRAVMAARALAAPHRDDVAPVIDIRTRQRLA